MLILILTRRVSLLAKHQPQNEPYLWMNVKADRVSRGSFVINWSFCFSPPPHLYSWCIFISVTDLSLSLTHAPPPLHLQIHCSHLPAMIQVPGVPLTPSSIGCLIDGSPQAREPAQGHLSENAHPLPPPAPSATSSAYSHLSILTYIHPSLHSPTPASHASALTSLINQGLSQSAVWAVVHSDHLLLLLLLLLLLTLSTFLI